MLELSLMTQRNTRIGGRGQLTILEGVPGSGKSTTIANICKNRPIYVSTELDHVRSGVSCTDLLGWYVTAELNRQETIQKVLRAGIDAIQDRCVVSTIAYAYAHSRMVQNPQLFARCKERVLSAYKSSPTNPARIILLMTTIPTSISRRRQHTRKDYAEWFDPHFLTHYWRFYRHWVPAFIPGAHILDTTSLKPNETTAEVRKLLMQRWRGRN